MKVLLMCLHPLLMWDMCFYNIVCKFFANIIVSVRHNNSTINNKPFLIHALWCKKKLWNIIIMTVIHWIYFILPLHFWIQTSILGKGREPGVSKLDWHRNFDTGFERNNFISFKCAGLNSDCLLVHIDSRYCFVFYWKSRASRVFDYR